MGIATAACARSSEDEFTGLLEVELQVPGLGWSPGPTLVLDLGCCSCWWVGRGMSEVMGYG